LISVVSIGELKSIALQNNWGTRRRQALNYVLEMASVMEVNENLANTYAEIDAYSQRRNPRISDYPFSTPRNMGKNDLWIAATAALLGLKLVTTDTDFNHLHQVFIDVQVLKPELFKAS
jgi:tRNA(fMet)-specific endonuclease VapC